VIWIAMVVCWIGGYCIGRAAIPKPHAPVADGMRRLRQIDVESNHNDEAYYAGEISDEMDVAYRSYLLRQRLIAAGELRPDQPGRPLLVTAMRRT
jgi:hypothetical protein